MATNDRRDYGTGSISQRKDGTWTARMIIGTNPNGKPKIKALYGKSEKEVKKKLKEFQKEFYKNDMTTVKKNTVESFMRDWLYEIKINSLKPKSFDRLEQTVLLHVIPQIGHLQIAAIQSMDIQKMINTLKNNGLSYSSVKKAYDAVNECFRTGVIQRTVIFNPALGVEVPSQKSFGKKEIRFYKDDEVEKLIAAATEKYKNGKRKYRLGDVIELDINTGLRYAELLGLRWEDVSIENKTISVKNTIVTVKDRSVKDNSKRTHKELIQEGDAKSESSIRTVPLNDAALHAISSLKEVTGNCEYVLSGEKGGRLTPRYLDRILRKVATSAKFPKDRIFGMHSLRHTFATKLFAKGIEVKTVSELLGHSDVMLTYNTYIHVIESQKEDAVKKI